MKVKSYKKKQGLRWRQLVAKVSTGGNLWKWLHMVAKVTDNATVGHRSIIHSVYGVAKFSQCSGV